MGSPIQFVLYILKIEIWIFKYVNKRKSKCLVNMAQVKKVTIPNTPIIRMDPFYRYKRDISIIVIQGQFYHFTNFSKICKQLKCDQKQMLKFISKILCQPVLEDKLGGLKLKSLPIPIEDVIEKFIDKYVLCGKCDLPELTDERICKCCGHQN